MDKKKKYNAGWQANNGSTYNNSYYGNNKKILAKEMREICRGNVFAGNTGNWYVDYIDCNDEYHLISGAIKN